MKLKINQQLRDVEGNILKGEKERPLTMRDVCINSLLTPVQGDDEKAKWEKYEIFKSMRDSKEEVDLKIEQITILKKAVGKVQPPLLMGQIWDMLENK